MQVISLREDVQTLGIQKTCGRATHLVDKKHGKIGYGLEFAGTEHGGNDRLCLDDIADTGGDYNCGSQSESSHFDTEQPNRTIEFWYWAEEVAT